MLKIMIFILDYTAVVVPVVVCFAVAHHLSTSSSFEILPAFAKLNLGIFYFISRNFNVTIHLHPRE